MSNRVGSGGSSGSPDRFVSLIHDSVITVCLNLNLNMLTFVYTGAFAVKSVKGSKSPDILTKGQINQWGAYSAPSSTG